MINDRQSLTHHYTHPASIVLPATLSHSLYSNARYTGTYTIPILNVTILKGIQSGSDSYFPAIDPAAPAVALSVYNRIKTHIDQLFLLLLGLLW
jgi:hypothetical protein